MADPLDDPHAEADSSPEDLHSPLSQYLADAQAARTEELIDSYANHGPRELLADCDCVMRCLVGFDNTLWLTPKKAAELAQSLDGAWLDGFNRTHEMLCLAATARKIDVEPYKRLADTAYTFWQNLAGVDETRANMDQLYGPGIRSLLNLKRVLIVEAAKGEPEPAEPSTDGVRRCGRKKAGDETIRREEDMVFRWERARDAGVYMPDFARDEGMSLKELEKLIARVRMRNLRANK